MDAMRTTICTIRTRIASRVRCTPPSRTTASRDVRVRVSSHPRLTASPKGAISFWEDHLKHSKTPNEGTKERFGQKYLRFSHPSGLQIEVIEDDADKRKPWEVGRVTKDVGTKGFHGPVLSVREVDETKRFFIDALGFRETGVDGNLHRLEVAGGGPARTIILQHDPNRPSGSWTFGAGTAHHVAFDVPSDEALAEQKGVYEELGYTDCSEIKDRNYFHSIYCRCPGGILVECAATAPGAFTRDEPADELGTSLLLPPWFEEQRAAIVAMLEPVRVPEGNLPKGAKVGAGGVPVVSAAEAAANASKRAAVFIKPEDN